MSFRDFDIRVAYLKAEAERRARERKPELEIDIEEQTRSLDEHLMGSYFMLYQVLRWNYPLECIFREGRLLHETPSREDPATGTMEYFYRKVLSFDSRRRATVLSKEGTKNSKHLLEEPEREYTFNELKGQPIGDYAVRPMSWDIDR